MKSGGVGPPEADKPWDTCLPAMYRKVQGQHKATRSTWRLSTGYWTRLLRLRESNGGQATPEAGKLRELGGRVVKMVFLCLSCGLGRWSGLSILRNGYELKAYTVGIEEFLKQTGYLPPNG